MEGAIAGLQDKKHVRVGAGTVIRYKEPTSRMALYNTQFVVDYSEFQKHTPDMRKGILIESSTGPRKTKGRGVDNRQSINPSTNRSCVFGPMRDVFLGSSPDQKGNF
jgi:hypothetical protein